MISQVTCVAHLNLIKMEVAVNNKPTAQNNDVASYACELMLNKPFVLPNFYFGRNL